MKELKITKGEYSHSPQKGNPGYCYQAQVWLNGKNLASVEPTKNKEEASQVAEIFSQSLTVANQTGLMPSELLEQRNELLEMVKEIKSDFTQYPKPIAKYNIAHMEYRIDKLLKKLKPNE